MLFSQFFSFTVVGQNLYQQSKHILLQLLKKYLLKSTTPWLINHKIDKQELISVLAKVTEKELMFLGLQVIEGASRLLAQKCWKQKDKVKVEQKTQLQKDFKSTFVSFCSVMVSGAFLGCFVCLLVQMWRFICTRKKSISFREKSVH